MLLNSFIFTCCLNTKIGFEGFEISRMSEFNSKLRARCQGFDTFLHTLISEEFFPTNFSTPRELKPDDIPNSQFHQEFLYVPHFVHAIRTTWRIANKFPDPACTGSVSALSNTRLAKRTANNI